MIKRINWLNRIEILWRERSIVWLSGVRRAGKTILSKSLSNIEYFDCELPRVRSMLADSEMFLKGRRGKRIVLDEIHRLENPSELLKIAADHFPQTNILATGSSSLGASAKFKDTLTGRKAEIWLTPMISDDLKCFKNNNLKHRLLFGGLPPFFLSKKLPEKYFQEWIDSFWAKDIQELFRLERRNSFQKFLELLMIQSGGIFEANKFSSPCGVSHTTISNYLSVLDQTYVVNILRPFNTRKKTEIIAAPKVYMFDTGFVCYYKGIHDLNSKEMGIMWEHYVLNELQAHLQSRQIRYWRDKNGHEVDFIIERRGLPPVAIEAKLREGNFDYESLKTFKHYYPGSEIYVVASNLSNRIIRKIDGFQVNMCGLSELIKYMVRQASLL